MDLHYRQEITVGALVLTGVAAFVLGTMWLSGKESRSGKRIVNVQFADVGNMKSGNPVKVSGVQLGRVDEIEFRDVGDVLVTLQLDPRIQPKTDATALLSSVGLVGDVVIVFDPGKSPTPLPPDAVVKGLTERGLMDIGGDLSSEATATMTSLRDVVNKDLAADLQSTLRSFQRLANSFSDPKTGPGPEINATMVELRRLTTRLDSVLASPGLNRVVSNADSATVRFARLADQFTVTGARVDTLLIKINRGDGTLGKLMSDTTMYVQLRELSASLKSFVDDLKKNPGKIPIQVKIF
jgi:phospholipid/cholesterol/gamma-HCH transport system substrate-binding protein